MTTRGFPVKEYEARWTRLAEAMREAKLDAVLVTSEVNFRYFTGFDSQTWVSPTRPRYLVLRDDADPVAIVPSSNVSGMRRTPVRDIRSWQAPNPADEGISTVRAVLSEAAHRFGAIGAELGPESRLGMPGGDFLRLIEELRPIEVRDAVGPILAMRMIKSPREIERIERIAGIASDGFAALPDLVAGCSTLREVCQVLSVELLKRGADKTPYLVGEAGRGGYESLIMGPDDRRLAAGDVVFIDTGATYDGYFCDFNRNYAVGQPADIVRDAHATMFRATEAGIAAIRPGRKTSEVWRAMAGVLQASGGRAGHIGRMGHGLGLSLTEPPSIHPADETVLVAGMVLTVEPSMTYAWPAAAAATKLMVHEENLVVTEDGCRLLSRRAPSEMPILSIGPAT